MRKRIAFTIITACVLLITGCGVSNSAEVSVGADRQMAENIGQNDTEENIATDGVADYPAAIMVNDTVYLVEGNPMPAEVDESAIIGYTESYTDTFPENNGETNFNPELGMPYTQVEDGIAVFYKNEWYLGTPFYNQEYNSNNMEFISSQDSMDETEEINFETHQELKLIGVVDTYANANELTALFEDRDSLERMISFNQILNDQFEFYEIYNQPLQSKFYWNMDDSFLKCYDGVPIKNQEIEIDGENCFISTLNSFQLNLNAYNHFFDFIGEGRGFCESDFQYKRNEKVPIILGSDYKSYYSIGDSIKLNYLEKDFEYEIIGFFEQGLNIKIENSEYSMNKYLCIPFFEFDGNVIDDSEKVFWLRCYEEKNLGYIKVDIINDLSEEETIEFYKTKIQESAEKLMLKYSTLDIIYDISSEIANNNE